MQVRFFDPGKGYRLIKQEIDSEIQRVLSGGDLILRDDVDKFEENLAKFTGKKYAVGLNSGTDALYLSLKVLGLGSGCTVSVPSHTFVATAQVVEQIGANIELFDLNEKGDESDSLLSCVIVVHIAGEVAEIPPHTVPVVPVVEDACQSLGAKGVGRGTIQCYSFYPAKILGAYGDAGAITTDDGNLASEIRELRNHYKKDYSKWGINSRLDNLQSAVLNVKMKYLPETLAKRKKVAETYLHELKRVGLPNNSEGRVWQDFIIRVPGSTEAPNLSHRRDDLYDFLKQNGIETMKNEYPMPIAKLPLAAEYEAETLRIPCNELLEDNEVEYVIEKVNEFSHEGLVLP